MSVTPVAERLRLGRRRRPLQVRRRVQNAVDVEQHPPHRVGGLPHHHGNVLPAVGRQLHRTVAARLRYAVLAPAPQADPPAVQPEPVVGEPADDGLLALRMRGADPGLDGKLLPQPETRAVGHAQMIVQPVEGQRPAVAAVAPGGSVQHAVVAAGVVVRGVTRTLVEAPPGNGVRAPHRPDVRQPDAAECGSEQAAVEEGGEDAVFLRLGMAGVVEHHQQAAGAHVHHLRIGEVLEEKLRIVQHHLVVGEVPGGAAVERRYRQTAAVATLVVHGHQGAVAERDQQRLAGDRRVPQVGAARRRPGAPVVGRGGLLVVLADRGAGQHYQVARSGGLGDVTLVGPPQLHGAVALETQPAQLHQVGSGGERFAGLAQDEHRAPQRGVRGDSFVGGIRDAAEPQKLAVRKLQHRRAEKLEAVAELGQLLPAAPLVMRA